MCPPMGYSNFVLLFYRPAGFGTRNTPSGPQEGP
jgi:hypothetical protein